MKEGECRYYKEPSSIYNQYLAEDIWFTVKVNGNRYGCRINNVEPKMKIRALRELALKKKFLLNQILKKQ